MTVFDLVAHSVLNFPFQGDIVRKGWTECLVIGDTRCGKSETVDKLFQHYRCGELVTGENASYAGLVGGLQQTQKTWSITWGKLPLSDRRMCGIDELSGLEQAIIGRMSGIRSSGIAEIIKIQMEKTLARVRIIWMSNPRGKLPLAAFNSGIDAIQNLIGAPEDIARFDLALTVATNEVPLTVINSSSREVVPHTFTSDHCRRLVYWAWSRKPGQVQFSTKATEAVLSHATDLSKRYVAPLVEGAEQRIKVARLSVAAAARVFSSTNDGQTVLVEPEHVEFVAQFLDEVYCKPSMAYDRHSRAKIQESTLNGIQEIQAKLELLPTDFRGLVADTPSFTVADLQDFAGLNREQAIELGSFLVRKRCIKKGKFGYYKLPAFIRFLRDFRRGVVHREDTSTDPPF